MKSMEVENGKGNEGGGKKTTGAAMGKGIEQHHAGEDDRKGRGREHSNTTGPRNQKRIVTGRAR